MKTHLLHTKITIWLTILSLWNISAINSAPNQDDQYLQADKIIFAVIGDYGETSQAEADVANLVKSWNPDFIVTVGDNNYPNGAASTIDENIGQYYHEYIFPYRGTYGAGAAYKSFFPALGNHDWITNGAKPYFNYFSFYNENGYYDFTKGELHFFVLDSDSNEPDGISSTSEQAKWLRKGLAASSSDFNIVVFHHAPFSSGKHGSTLYMQWPFKAWGADAIISGHDHLYERIDVDGLPYFVNGVGGAELYSFGATVPGSQIRFNQDYGAMRVETGNSSLKFQFYTRAGILIDEYTIRRTVPIVSSVSRLNSNPSNSSIVNFLVTFSEAVTGVDSSDFSLFTTNIQGASINGFDGSGNTYTVSVNTGTSDGTIRLDLIDNDSIVNGLGNKLGDDGAENGSYITGETYSFDKSAPSVISITRQSSNPTLTEIVEFLVTFSEPVTGLDQTDLSVNSTNGASINTINGSGNLYIVSVNNGSGVDALRVDLLDDDSITDQAGNKLGGGGSGNGNYLAGETYIVDRAAPFVTSIICASANPSNSASIDFIVTFSEMVTGVDASDFNLSSANISGASISSINNINPFYILTVNTGIGIGTISLELSDDDSIADAVGNRTGGQGGGNGNFVNGEACTIEKSFPTVTSIIRSSPNPSSSANVDFIVTFSESVTGVDPSDFNLSATNIINASITNVINVDPFYVVSVNTGIGAGSLRLDFIDDDSIANHSGSTLGGQGAGNGNFVNGEVFSISKTAINFPAPSLREPRQNFLTNISTPSFSWDKVRGASAYEIMIASDSDFTQIASIQVVNGLSYTSNIMLNDNIYYWRIRAYNSGFQPGKFSKTYKFTIDTTPPLAPNLLSPPNNTTTFKTNFSWEKISSATRYQIEIDNNSDFSSPEWSSILSDTTYHPSNMRRGLYYWHVRAKDMAGNWGVWSIPFTIIIP